jgi:hypothetical protein
MLRRHTPKKACFLSTEVDSNRKSQSSDVDCGGYSIEVSGTTTFNTEDAKRCSKDMSRVMNLFYAPLAAGNNEAKRF